MSLKQLKEVYQDMEAPGSNKNERFQVFFRHPF